MVDYIMIQNEMIVKYNVDLVIDSKCWQRTHAHCDDNSRRICKHKVVNSYKSLFTLLHEIGHLETYKSSMKRCESESAATVWAIERIKELGLPVKRKITKSYKKYIQRTYDRGVRRGLQKRIKSKLYL